MRRAAAAAFSALCDGHNCGHHRKTASSISLPPPIQLSHRAAAGAGEGDIARFNQWSHCGRLVWGKEIDDAFAAVF